MRRYFRTAIVFLICIAQILSIVGCAFWKTVEDVIMNANRIQDTRQPTLTQPEIELLVSRYGVTRDLVATEETLQILMTEDVFPESIIETVLPLPTEQVPDEIYSKLADLFLTELSLEQMARFIELCFDTYEHPNDSSSMLLLANTERFRRLRRIMEDLLVDSRYEDRDMLHRYSTFVSASFIPVAVSNSHAEIRAFSIVEQVDTEMLGFLHPNGEEARLDVNSFIFDYIGLYERGLTDIAQSIQIFQTALPGRQLSEFMSFVNWIYLNYARNLRRTDQFERVMVEADFDAGFMLGCYQRDYALTRVVFSDESLMIIRFVFPLAETHYYYPTGESYSTDHDGSIRGRLITARELPELESVENETSEERLSGQNGASEESIVEQSEASDEDLFEQNEASEEDLGEQNEASDEDLFEQNGASEEDLVEQNGDE